MSLADLLQQIVGGASQPNASQLDQVTQSASKADLQGGVSAALRSDQTPDLSQIVSQMFGQASPEQQAAILNTITEKLGPGALAGVAGGVLAGHEGADTPQVSAAKAGTVTPDHDPIKALNWPAMVMPFKVADKALLGQMKVGAKIRFQLNGQVIVGVRPF